MAGKVTVHLAIRHSGLWAQRHMKWRRTPCPHFSMGYGTPLPDVLLHGSTNKKQLHDHLANWGRRQLNRCNSSVKHTQCRKTCRPTVQIQRL